MKYVRIFSILFFLWICVTPVVAQTDATATATKMPIPTIDKTKQIEELKDRLATKVAELRQTQRMGVYGTITAVSISTFSIETKTKNLKIEFTDDITVFQNLKGKRTELKQEDLAKNDVVTVFGEYDTTLELLKAKIIFIHNVEPIKISGIIQAVNKTDYSFDIKTPEGKTYTVDFETVTKTSLWNGKTTEKGGFSKLLIGDTVHIIGSLVPKKENRISALRIVDLNQFGAPEIALPTPAVETASVSGTPTTKTTMKPTVKPTTKTTTLPTP